MEDDHVDRPGVEERQRLKLTGTNNSIGLIVLITHSHHAPDGAIARKQLLEHVCFVDLVVMAELLHPIPFRTRP